MRSLHAFRPALLRVAAVASLLAGLVFMPAAASAADAAPRIDLRVLVVTDGGSSVEAIRHGLGTQGVPTTLLSLGDPQRPAITAAYLSDLVGSTPRAKFQAVVLPNEAPSGLQPAELAALAAFQTQFGVRQVNAFSYPSPAIGMATPPFAGTLDGSTAQVTAAAKAGALRYLNGPVRFTDGDPAVWESYGYLSTALPDDPATGAHVEPYLTGTSPDGSATGVLAGVYTQSGREQLTFSFAYNAFQEQFQLLAPGIVGWMTRGVHLGHHRNYLSVHVDDVFSGDDRWSVTGNCTPGDIDCATPTTPTPPIRMTPADVTQAVQWQQSRNFRFDLLYNGLGSDDAVAEHGSDPLTAALLQNRAAFRWTNHTYAHTFLGCVQDVSVVPWRCATDPATGQPRWTSKADIVTEITKNLNWGANRGLPLHRGELVAGEHSGTKILPQQPQDNPNFVAALTQTGIKWLGLDASREPAQRQVGSALSAPRYPLSVYYNVGTAAEQVDEYNWIYTSRANGGSGICEDNPATTTCIAPLDPATGYSGYIVPKQVEVSTRFMLGNDPRPHYVHQSNLAEDRLIYPMVDALLTHYRAALATNTPLVNPRLAEATQAMQRQAGWRTAVDLGRVTAYTQGGKVTVGAPSGLEVPITVPNGTRSAGLLGLPGPVFGEAYAGERSAYQRSSGAAIVLTLPAVGG